MVKAYVCYQFPAVYTNVCELEKLGISAVYFGSAQIDLSSESKALCAESNTLVVFVSPELMVV